MNRKNWTSALVALMMVISMLTCFVVPTAMADTDMVLPEDAVSVQEVSTSESTNFYIETIEDLIYAASNWSKYVAGDTIYLVNDLDIDTYDGDFSGEFAGFGTGQDSGKFMRANFDGLGHTIYNYNHNVALFGGMAGNVSNLTLVDATVNSGSGYEGILFGFTSVGVNANVTVKNVHFVNCHLTNTTGYVGLMFGYLHNKTRSVAMENCSAINSSVTDNGQSAGLFFGRIGDAGNVVMKNVLAYNCVVTDAGAANRGGGLLGGDFYPKVAGGINLTVDNVAVIDCARESTSSATSVLYGYQNSGTAKVTATISNVYAFGNTTDGEVIDVLVKQLDTDSTATFTNVMTDASVLASNNSVVNNDNIIPAMDVYAAAALMNEKTEFRWAVKEGDPLPANEENPEAHLITFEAEEGDMYFGTDVDGAFHLDVEDLMTLEGKDWLDAQSGETWIPDWGLTYSAAHRYVENGLHRYRYIPAGGDSHKLVCLGEDGCGEHPDTVLSCLEDEGAVRKSSLDADEVKYISPAVLGYSCNLCGNSFTTPDPQRPMATPVVVTVDREDYATGDIAEVTVSAVEDSGIASFVAALEYDSEYLSYSEDDDFSEDEGGGWIDLLDVTEPVTLKFMVGTKATDIKLTIVYAEDAEGNSLSFHENALEATATIKNSIVSVYEVETSDSTKFSIFTVEELIFAASKYNKFALGDTIYLYDDLYIDEYDGNFASEFSGFGGSTDTAMFSANFDGRGHTIYGYNDTNPMFNKVSTITISNLTFESPAVGTAGSGVASGYGLILGVNAQPKTGGTVVIENVHVKGGMMYTAGGNCGWLSGFSNGRDSALTIENCSVINSTIDSGNGNVGVGIISGTYKTVSGHPVVFKNVVAVGNTIKGGVTSYGNGLLIGYWNATTSPTAVTFENILAMDNVIESDGKYQMNIISHRRAGNRNYTVKNFISIDNMEATDVDRQSTYKAINRLFTDTGFVLAQDWSVICDVNLMLADTASSSNSKTAKKTTDMFNLQGAVALLNEKTAFLWTVDANGDVVPAGTANTPNAITFKDEDNTTVLAILGSDPATGKLVADNDALEMLETKAWYDNTGKLVIRLGEDTAVWADVAPVKNCTYLAVAEDDLHLPQYYITLDNGKHIVTCGDAACDDERATVDCTRVHDHDEADIPGTYYVLPLEGKTCSDCGGIWVVDGEGLVPVLLVPDKEEYPIPNEFESNEVKVDVELAEDAYAEELTVEVTYDPAELAYTGYVDQGFDYVLDDTVDGVLIISFEGIGSQPGELCTLLFETVSTVTVDSGLDLEITHWVAAESEDSAYEDLFDELIAKNSSAAFQIYYIRAYTVGDVYGKDEVVNLRDAVVLLQVLSSQRSKDDEDFNLLAANVVDPNGPEGAGANTVDTADLLMILQVVTGQIDQRKLREVHEYNAAPEIIVAEMVIPK